MKVPPLELAERLWEVADRAFQQPGDVRVDDLAELTGIPRATLYYYFSGKDDIAAFLLAQTLQRGTEAIADAARPPGDISQRLEAVLRAMLHTMAEHPALCTRLLGGMMNQGGGPELMTEVERTLMAPVRDLLTQGIATGDLAVTDTTDTTLSLMGAISTVAMVRTANNTYDPDDVANSLVPQLINGLRRR
jgi:TetR/AcrR family transcriptional regulator